ncbi:MAG: two-component system phosphate regulon sensor histidine kinase PhoR [Planctomycetota bacterium]|jgi:two-component system phosphate regulon sensor histidine kinase PhoR
MATTTNILILATGASAARLQSWFAEAGAQVVVAASIDAVAEHVATGDLRAVVADLAFVGDALQSLHECCQAGDVDMVIAVDGVPQPAHYERGMALSALGVIGAASSASDAGKLLERLHSRVNARSRARGEAERWRVQSEELRRRCKQQAEKFQETQETFYLDLSRMMTIITNIMDGIVFVDRGGNVTLMNPVAENLLGMKSFVAIGKPISIMQGQHELLDALVEDHARLEEQKEVFRTVEVHDSEQDLLYIKCMTSRVHDYRGHPAGTLTVLRDITAEFKTDQLKNQYLSIVAHELRTPLTGIKTFATMMAKGSVGELNDRQVHVCESIREQSVRLEHQIDKLINLGNLESEDYGQDREVVAIDDFLAGMLMPFEQPARDRRVALSLDSDIEGVQLFADRADLRRACQALIENAVKFARDDGCVRVVVVAEGDGLRFCVGDDGIGIDPRYQRRIFEKFFQVEDPLTRHHGGAGLGLFVARGIIEAHGGQIEVSSQLGQGADFSFMLPIYQPEHAGVVTETATD